MLPNGISTIDEVSSLSASCADTISVAQLRRLMVEVESDESSLMRMGRILKLSRI